MGFHFKNHYSLFATICIVRYCHAIKTDKIEKTDERKKTEENILLKKYSVLSRFVRFCLFGGIWHSRYPNTFRHVQTKFRCEIHTDSYERH